MFNGLTLFYSIIFCGAVFSVVNAMVFMRGTLFASAALNFLSIMIMLYGAVMKLSGINGHVHPEIFVIAGISLYPVSVAFMLRTQVFFRERVPAWMVYSASGIFFLGAVFFPSVRQQVIPLVFIPGLVYILGNITLSYGEYFRLSMTAASALVMSAAAAAGFFFSLDTVVSVCASGGYVFFIFLILSFRLKVNAALKQNTVLSGMNLKLAQSISLYKQSNDQCRKLIVDRELDLFQLARHASLAELTTGIAHELSQPLTGIKGIAQNMIDDINYEEYDALQAVSELMKITFLVDKSSLLIDHIRKFSRKKIFSMSSVSLNSVIIDAIELVRLQVKKHDVEIIFVLDDNISRINGDSISLEQLLVNLMLNAKDAIVEKNSVYTERGGLITVATASHGRSVVLTIQDNGIGMTEDVVQKMWSPFFTTKKKDQGTGIGLSLSRKIIRDHGAAVEVKSSRGEGTVFDIFFPVAN